MLSDSEVVALDPGFKKWRDISVPCDHTALLAEHSPDGISDDDDWRQADLDVGCIDYVPTPGDDLDGKGLVSEGHITVAESYTVVQGVTEHVTICWPDGGKISLSLSTDGAQHSYQEGSHDRQPNGNGQTWTRADHRCQILDTIECLPYELKTVSKTLTGVTHQMTFYRYINAHGDYGKDYTPHHINDLLPVTVEWFIEASFDGTSGDLKKEIDPLSYDAKSADQKPCSDPNSSCHQGTKEVDPLSYDDKPDYQKPGYVKPTPAPNQGPKKVDPFSYDDKPADQKPCSDPNSSCYQGSKKD